MEFRSTLRGLRAPVTSISFLFSPRARVYFALTWFLLLLSSWVQVVVVFVTARSISSSHTHTVAQTSSSLPSPLSRARIPSCTCCVPRTASALGGSKRAIPHQLCVPSLPHSLHTWFTVQHQGSPRQRERVSEGSETPRREDLTLNNLL